MWRETFQTEDFSQVASVAGGRKGVTKWCVTNMVNPSRAAILSHVPGLIICARELSGACLRSGRT